MIIAGGTLVAAIYLDFDSTLGLGPARPKGLAVIAVIPGPSKTGTDRILHSRKIAEIEGRPVGNA